MESHRAIVAAVEVGDAELARRLLFAIMSRHHEFVMGLYTVVDVAAAAADGEQAMPGARA